MRANNFSAGEILRFGWMKTKKFFVFFFGIFVLIFSLNFLIAFFENTFSSSNESLFLADTLSCFADLVVGLGLIKIALDICDEKIPDIRSFFSNFDVFLNYAVGFILFSLLVAFGILLLVIPGIICFLKFQFFGHFVVDKRLSPIDALKESARITSGVKIELIGFGILVCLINFLGVSALGIGLIASIPTTIIAHAALYRKLAYKSINTKAA